jgi:glutathione S-transferase
MLMKVYYAPNSRAVRIVWLLEELGLDYEVERFALGDKAMRAPNYLQIHPMGRVPALEDDGVMLFESGAIVEYVLARHGNGRMVPSVDSAEYPTYLQWLHYAEGMIMPPVNTIVVETLFLSAERRNQTNIDRATKLLGRMLTAVDQALAEREFLAGEFSGADIMTGHATIVAARLGADLSGKPNVQAYVERLQARPGLSKAWDV